MEEFIKEFMDHLSVERGLSKNTLESYGRDLAKYSGYLKKAGITDLNRVKRPDIQNFLMSLKDNKLNASSIARKVGIWSAPCTS